MVSDIFSPIIPVLVGAGMLMALNNVLTAPKIFHPEMSFVELNPAWAGFAEIVNMLSAAAFAFLPILVGYSATNVFGGNPYLGMTMGAAMVSPALVNGYQVATSLQDGSMTYWDVFGLQVAQSGYQGTVLPILFVAFLLAKIEKFFHKVLRGETLVEFDMEQIASAGYPLTTPLVITNAKKTVEGCGFAGGVASQSAVDAGDEFLNVKAREHTPATESTVAR
ncbi:PTS transporter subunit EIIC [Rothia sp. LK2588]|uniref:PTS transporter subunit EIIC n=1 Tax=Rothia sp. LK2588 TaxID=3114369 RepID=UPI0034CE3602